MQSMLQITRRLSTTLPKSLSEVAPLWVNGCGRCAYGLVNPPAIKANGIQTVADIRLSQFVSGALNFCDCEAGERYQGGMMKRAKAPSQAQELQQAKADNARKRKERIWANANVPPHYAQYTLKSYVAVTKDDPGKQAAIAAIMAHFKGQNERPGIMLCGPTNLGKTGALCPLFIHYVDERNYGGLWLPYKDMLAEARNFDGGNAREKIEAAKTIDYLFIDDMGDTKRQQATDYERDVVWEIVDHRNNYQMATFITSNLDAARLVDYYSPELVKRLRESCEIVPVTGKELT